MTKQQVQQIKGKLGMFDLNGSKYHKLIVGIINQVEEQSAVVERLQGEPIPVFIKNIEGFEPLPDHRQHQRLCPVCLIGKVNLEEEHPICDRCRTFIHPQQKEALRKAPELIE